MGTSFFNLQVYRGQLPADEVRARIVDVLRHRLAAEEFVPLANGEDEGDWTIRDIYLTPDDETPWIGIYDIHSPWQERLNALAAAVTAATGGVAIGVALEDSDVLELYLHQDGALIDVYSSYPEYTDHDPADYVGHPERWRDLLVGGATPDDLRAAWDERPLFAEHLLRPVAALFGGGKSWWGDWRDASFQRQSREPDGMTRLVFRSVQPLARPQSLTGPPRLIASGWTQGIERTPAGFDAAVGDTLQPFPLTIINSGGAARGVRVEISGSALADRLVTISSVEITSVAPGGMGPAAIHRATIVPAASGAAFAAELLDLAIPAGIAGDRHFSAMSGQSAHISLAINGRVVAAGRGEIHLTIVPLSNADGADEWRIPIAITVAPRRPLRCPPGRQSTYLRPLETSPRLGALVALGADRATSVVAALTAIERWWTFIAPADDRDCTVALTEARDRRPRVARPAARQLLETDEWQTFSAALVDCAALTGHFDVGRDGNSFSEGFSFDVLTIAGDMALPGDAPLPYLTLSYALAGLDAREREAAIASLVAIVDAVMVRADGVQALIARWSGGIGTSYGATTYELACNIYGQSLVNGRIWGTRYLRGVTEQLWLGPDLLARLGDDRALRAVADLTPIGAGQRVALRADADLAALERALAPLLPSADDLRSVERDRRT